MISWSHPSPQNK